MSYLYSEYSLTWIKECPQVLKWLRADESMYVLIFLKTSKILEKVGVM